MASNTTQVHFRTVSSTGMSRRPSAQSHYRSSLDLKADEDDALDHQTLLANANAVIHGRLPRSYRSLRTSAVLGWSLSFILFLTLVVSHSTMAPEIPRVDLRGMSLGGARLQASPQENGVAATGKQTTWEPAYSLQYPKQAGGLQSRVTIVSGFYRIESGKKHRVSEYHEWLTTFLNSVELPIVFYCAPELRNYIKTLRGNKPITIISEHETPFTMPPLDDLGGRDWAVAQHNIDPERHVHVPDVYGVWTAKPWIVKNAKDRNPYHSEYFFWVDAGGFREANVVHTFTGLAKALDKIYATVPDDTLILSSTVSPFEPGLDYVLAASKGGELDRSDKLQGGWYGGKAAGIDWWEKETMKVTVLQAAMQRFSAKEQPVWTQAARLNWRKIYVQNMDWRTGPDCGPDMWFAFEQFADGDDCDIPAWNGPQYAKEFDKEEENRRKEKELLGP